MYAYIVCLLRAASDIETDYMSCVCMCMCAYVCMSLTYASFGTLSEQPLELCCSSLFANHPTQLA